MSVFIICSSVAAIGAIVYSSKIGAVDGNAVAATPCCSRSGRGHRWHVAVRRQGSVRDAVFAGAVLATVQNGLTLLGFQAAQVNIITGSGAAGSRATVDALSRRRATAHWRRRPERGSASRGAPVEQFRQPAGTRPDEVRRHNRAALLRRLHVDGPCTRAAWPVSWGSTLHHQRWWTGWPRTGWWPNAAAARRSGRGRPSLLVLPQALAAVVLTPLATSGVEHGGRALVGIGGEILRPVQLEPAAGHREPREVFTRSWTAACLLIEELAVT